jgi:hypothetical protein
MGHVYLYHQNVVKRIVQEGMVDVKELTYFNHQYLELTSGWHTRGGNFMAPNWPCEPSPEK